MVLLLLLLRAVYISYNFYNFKLHSFTDVLQLRQKSSFFRLKNLNYFFAVTFESSRREMREEEKWRNGDFPEWRRRFENLPKYVFFKYLLRDLANFFEWFIQYLTKINILRQSVYVIVQIIIVSNRPNILFDHTRYSL